MGLSDPKKFLEDLFYVAVKASVPAAVMSAHMPKAPKGKTIIIGAGKASSQMGAALEAEIANDPNWHSPVNGLVVTQYGSGVVCDNIEIVEAAHPVPDEKGLVAAKRMVELVSDAGPDDLVVALISGGGSSLLPSPANGLTLADKQALNRALLASGAPISAMNSIRKMFSKVKGGRLGALAHPGRLVSLVISDVPGDEAAMVASGPTIPDSNGVKEARDFIAQYEIELSPALENYLEQADASPLPDDPCFSNASYEVIASAKLSLEVAAKAAQAAGCDVKVLSDAIEGEANIVGRKHGELIKKYTNTRPFDKPVLILSGGETSVTIGKNTPKGGKGGRNSEYLLSLAMEISGMKDLLCLAADTDGRDGSEDNAGAYCDGGSLLRMAERGADGAEHLKNHDAWTAFRIVEDLLITGPTGTNVNDFRAFLLF